jgi:chromosome segregation ATPase
MPSLARVDALEKLEARAEGISDELRQFLVKQGALTQSDRQSWEDRLLQRQHTLESQAAETRGLWHKLEAQLDQLSQHVSSNALRTEHEDLSKRVEELAIKSATKLEMGAVDDRAKAAAKGDAFVVLEADVHALQAAHKAQVAASAEGLGRAADAQGLAALDERVAGLQKQLDAKMGQQEAQFALAAKLEKVRDRGLLVISASFTYDGGHFLLQGIGEQLGAEVEAANARLATLHERANGAELSVTTAQSELQATLGQVADLQKSIESLRAQQNTTRAQSQHQTSDVRDLIKAVRALTQDAEMRCALDEREIEFLWAAPGHIYGQHGWRPNNGSKSERTPYPAGNFQMAVKHGV